MDFDKTIHKLRNEAAWTINALQGFLSQAADGITPRPPDSAPFTERATQRAEEGVPLDAIVRTYLAGGRRLLKVLREQADIDLRDPAGVRGTVEGEVVVHASLSR